MESISHHSSAVPRMYRFGFILSTSLGNATRYRIFKKFALRDETISFTWAPVKHYYSPSEYNPVSKIPAPFYSRAVVLAQSWPVLGKLNSFDAVMIHQLEAQPLALMRQLFVDRPLIVAAQDNPPVIDPKTYPAYASVVNNSWWRKKLRLKAELWAARNTPLHITFSNWQAATLIEKCGIASDRVHSIHTGLDLSEWSRPVQKLTAAKPSILFVGGDLSRKGGDTLIRVFLKHFVGKATLDVVTADSVNAAHPDMRVHNGLEPGSQQLKALYRHADIFAFPTRADISPWVCLEAMASETAVIATDVGGVKDMVRDGVTGRLIQLEDPTSLQMALADLIENPLLCQEMGIEGRKVVERDFDAASNVPKILDLMKTHADRLQYDNKPS